MRRRPRSVPPGREENACWLSSLGCTSGGGGTVNVAMTLPSTRGPLASGSLSSARASMASLARLRRQRMASLVCADGGVRRISARRGLRVDTAVRFRHPGQTGPLARSLRRPGLTVAVSDRPASARPVASRSATGPTAEGVHRWRVLDSAHAGIPQDRQALGRGPDAVCVRQGTGGAAGGVREPTPYTRTAPCTSIHRTRRGQRRASTTRLPERPPARSPTVAGQPVQNPSISLRPPPA